MLNRRDVLAGLAALAAPALSSASHAQGIARPALILAIPQSVAVAPLALAEQRGLFARSGVDVRTRIIPRAERDAAMAAGTVDGLSISLDAAVMAAAAGRPVTQVLPLGRSHGDDGLVARPPIATVAELKGRRVACDGPGTSQFFFLGYVLSQAGLAVSDVVLTDAPPEAAAAALLAGRCDAAVTAGPDLAGLKANPAEAAVLTTTLDYPVMVTSLAFPPAFVAAQPGPIRGVVAGWFDALALIASSPEPSYATMAAWLGLEPAAFAARAAAVEWPTRVRARAIMTADLPALMKQGATVLEGAGVIGAVPDLQRSLDSQFVAA